MDHVDLERHRPGHARAQGVAGAQERSRGREELEDGRGPHAAASPLNLSGWYDDAYGPNGAFTNFLGLREARRGDADTRTRLIVGPWVHGVGATRAARAGERVFGDAAAIDYDETVLRFMDRYVRGLDNGLDREKPVRVFVMGEDVWKEGDTWPLAGTEPTSLFLSAREAAPRAGSLLHDPAVQPGSLSFVADPAAAVSDPFSEKAGAHDYRSIAGRPDVATFESLPLESDMRVVGPVHAEIFLSADAPDTDLWVKLYDVGPDGTAFNLMSPGLDVLRASLRNGHRGEPLEPGQVYRLRLDSLLTGNLFKRGHRIRVCLTTTFMPHFSPNLQTGESETTSSTMSKAKITIHTGRDAPSRIVLPIAP